MVRGAVAPLLITNAAEDPRFVDHPAPRLYGISSYVAVPLLRRDGSYFGVLCALDPKPSSLTEEVFHIFNLLASLIAFELEADERQRADRAELVEAQAIASARERFMGTVTHDLRTPLTAIKTTAQMILRKAWLPAEARPDISQIVESSNRIARLIADLLDFTRGRIGGGMSIQPAPTDVSALCRQVVDEAKSAFADRSIALSLPGPALAAVDAIRFGQAVSNLVSNALQHSPSGSPVDVRLRATAAELLLEVRNEGCIPPDVREHLFGPFRRGGSDMAHTGLGLGLFIVREIAQAHGGVIEMSAGSDVTVFQLRLPLH